MKRSFIQMATWTNLSSLLPHPDALKRHMAQINCTQVTEFILAGLTDHQELKMLLFVVFLSIYLFTVVGNLGLILVIRTDARFNTPTYFFLSHLAFVDFCYSSVITPKMLANFLYQQNVISFNACAAQLGCFLAFMTAECLLLASMAYDRYVAICSPLLYMVVMSPRICLQLVAAPYSYSFLVALFHTILTFRLSYCHSNIINHFYCDDMPLLRLTCSDTHSKQLWIFACAGIMFISSLLTVFVSYMYIITAILKMRSSEGRHKAFSTCGSHMLAVTIFYGTLIFMYLQPSSNHSLDIDKMASVFYTVIIPMLNPLIYSLRNKEVKDALKKVVINKNQAFLFMKLKK
ncbi:olfactory receptor 8U9-like [Loxodonta africana]|uniref:olfactory receptor 8U9-like n=1 Tax=Loxodonta africana TaxID=9785 RepID=UPI0030CA7F5A